MGMKRPVQPAPELTKGEVSKQLLVSALLLYTNPSGSLMISQAPRAGWPAKPFTIGCRFKKKGGILIKIYLCWLNSFKYRQRIVDVTL